MEPTITKQSHGYRLECEVLVPRRREEVFAFFADCRNLELLTPDELRFRILTPNAHETHEGLRIDYRLSLHGIRFRWQSEIPVWDPPVRFVDVQVRGPYRRWIHEHRFRETDGGTLVSDRVDYDVLGGGLVNGWLVAPQLRRIFAYRRERLLEALTAPSGTAPIRALTPHAEACR